jgi:hypothetical protein
MRCELLALVVTVGQDGIPMSLILAYEPYLHN